MTGTSAIESKQPLTPSGPLLRAPGWRTSDDPRAESGLRIAVPSHPTIEARIPFRQCARIIDSVHTEVMVQGYSDRTLVLVTQTGKIGSLTQVTVPLASFEQGYELASGLDDGLVPALPVPFTSLQLVPLLSSTPPDLKPLYDVYLNQIAMLALTGFSPDNSSHLRSCNPDRMLKPVIIGLALTRLPKTTEQDVTNLERARFSAIMNMIIESKVW
ncbi:hypothetical protein PTTG_12509 [Puccinia triticina 1-1 BBBD Race 1]|uniref:Proteasome assembly chaperone 3 n=1 Tax=Puccinia triticina (isolate 1-1 / race 1 (BBBD)) TaxID=630390 RepID=A0A180G019_PUCT1|nr:hypothetical protein PTTG_12509 [Puccinia triticina 1-1 BBBD Race 1]WAR54050.1 hypothetical protein PtB15_3B560 [Puccinia triticina]